MTDSNGNVVMQSVRLYSHQSAFKIKLIVFPYSQAGNHSGNGISVSSVSGGTSGEACASVGLPQQPQLPELPQLPHVPELPQLPQIPQPAVPAVPGLPGLSKEDLKKAVLEALLQLITQKAQQ